MSDTIPSVLDDVSMLRLIRQIAQNSANIYLTKHARERMQERGITRAQVEYCLRHGSIDEAVHQNIRGIGNVACSADMQATGYELQQYWNKMRPANGWLS